MSTKLTASQRELLQAVTDGKVTGMYHEQVEVWEGRTEGGCWSYYRSDSRRVISARITVLLRKELVSREEYDHEINLASDTIASHRCRIVLTGSGEAALSGACV